MWGGLHVVGTRYLQRTRRNSATRLSDPHDLTHTEDATTRRPRWLHASQTPRKKGDREAACVIDGKGSGKSRKMVDIHVNCATLVRVGNVKKFACKGKFIIFTRDIPLFMRIPFAFLYLLSLLDYSISFSILRSNFNYV